MTFWVAERAFTFGRGCTVSTLDVIKYLLKGILVLGLGALVFGLWCLEL